MNNNIGISVIIPVYNRESTIKNCIDSILNQTHLPQEIIIVDDSSTDSTIANIKSIKSTFVKILSNKHVKGAQGARNEGIKASTCDWIAFIDSDDEWLPDKLEKQVSLIKRNNLDEYNVIQCGCNKHFTETNTTEKWNIPIFEGSSEIVYPKLLLEPGPMFQGLLTSKIAFETIGYLDETIVSYQEWDTAIRLAKICKYHWVDEPLFNYTINSNDSTFNFSRSRIEGLYQVLSKSGSAIITIHGAKTFSSKIKNLVIDAFHCGFIDLRKKILNQNNKNIHLADKLLITIVVTFRLSKKAYENIIYFMKNPIFGAKHFTKKILLIRSLD